MRELVAELETLGLSDVRTYIQSGNVVFRSTETDPSTLAEAIGEAILASHGFEPCVMILSLEEFRTTVAACPFPTADEEPRHVHLWFLAQPAPEPDLNAIAALKAENEDYVLAGDVLYLRAPGRDREIEARREAGTIPRSSGHRSQLAFGHQDPRARHEAMTARAPRAGSESVEFS